MTATGTPTASTAAGVRPGGRAAPGVGRPSRPEREFRPGLEALRLAIHRPDDVGDRLEAALFRDDLQRAAFQALVDADEPPRGHRRRRHRRSGPSWCA